MWPDWLSLNMFLFCSVLLFHPTHSLRLESWSFLVHSMTTSPSPSKPAQLQSYSKIWLGLTVPKPPTASDIVNSVCIFSAPNNWAGVSYLQSNSFLDSEANLFLSQGLGSSPAPFPSSLLLMASEKWPVPAKGNRNYCASSDLWVTESSLFGNLHPTVPSHYFS